MRHGYTAEEAKPQMGFFTDTSLCIGCKACEVACKEWNRVPDSMQELTGMSYDNTIDLGANTWRHVQFIEQPTRIEDEEGFRWLMSSDVCKHCAEAACLDVCPTGALFRTEFDTVVVQEDVCNGCGYCVPACPFGVLDKREGDGRVWKCTLCYDRLKDDKEPACAQACPTNSIQFGELGDLREHAKVRVLELQEKGVEGAQLYGADENDGVGGMHSFFLLLDDPETYSLPPDPKVTTRDLPSVWTSAFAAAGALAVGIAASFVGARR
jgi:formate dehydrogenase iron-sulfur subunit